MTHLNRIIRLALGLLVSWYLVSCGSGDSAEAVFGDSFEIVAETSGGVPTGKGYFTVGFVKDIQDRRFVNIAVDFNGDGTWTTYPVGQTTQTEWVAQNMSAYVALSETYSFPFSIDDVSILARGNFKARVMMSERPIAVTSEAAGWNGTVPGGALASADFTVAKVKTFDVDALASPDPDELGTTGASLAAPLPLQALFNMVPKAAAAPSPAIRLLADATITDSVYHPGVPNLVQGHNECIPTSTANSLLWLADKYKFKDKMPGTPADLISELKTDFKWTARSGVYVASSKENPTGDGYLNGMGKFVNDRNLPIDVHQIGGRFDDNIFAKVMAELKKGQDVILDLEYQLPVTGRRIAGHGITIVGGWTASTGTNYLDVHDPANASAGTSSYAVDGTTMGKAQTLAEKVRPGGTFRKGANVYIRFAFAESPSSTTGTPPVTPVTPTPVTPPPSTQPPPSTTPTPVPSVLVNPTSLAVVHVMGTSPCPTRVGSFFVGESAVGALSWTITGIPTWLTLSKTSGTLATTADAQEVSVDFNCNVPSKGAYSAVLTVTGKDASGNTTGSVNVTVTVNVT